jgi:hypothetical protein
MGRRPPMIAVHERSLCEPRRQTSRLAVCRNGSSHGPIAVVSALRWMKAVRKGHTEAQRHKGKPKGAGLLVWWLLFVTLCLCVRSGLWAVGLSWGVGWRGGGKGHTESQRHKGKPKGGRGFGLVGLLCDLVPWCEVLIWDFRSFSRNTAIDGGLHTPRRNKDTMMET